MKHKIITDVSILRQISIPATIEESQSIIRDLEDSLADQRGLGLSAIQIGIGKRVSIVRIGKTKIDLINPKIIAKYDRFKHVGEGCLSLSGLRVDTIRYREIEVDNYGFRFVAEGIESLVIQHEIDHFNGKLLVDVKWRRK